MGAFGLTRQRQPSPLNGMNKPNGLTPEQNRETCPDAEETSGMGSTLMPNKAMQSPEPHLIAGLNQETSL